MPKGALHQWLKHSIGAKEMEISEHVVRELLSGRVSMAQIFSVLEAGRLIERWEHPQRRVFQVMAASEGPKPLHVIFSSSSESRLAILVVYEPKQPQWLTPYTRADHKDGDMSSQRRCFFCSGEIEPIVIGNFDYRLEGKLYVVKNVPAGLCLQCGEKYISLKSSQKIEALLATQQPEETETVGVLRYPTDHNG
ncbi:MAG: YgiT-type zinc finger protein [Deltaproteobacteria bacterium]|nr:YgiT-type zinc finger protein [Deltaproteobacteria bacterium]